MSSPERKPKKLLTAEQKYDLWVRMLAGQVTQAQAAAEVGELAAGHTEIRVAHLASGAVNVDAGSTCPRAALTAVGRGRLECPFGCCAAGCGAMQQQRCLFACGDSALSSAGSDVLRW